MVSLGIDVGGTDTKWVVLGADATIADSGSVRTPPGPGHVVDLAAELAAKAVGGGGTAREGAAGETGGTGIAGIGIGLPGHVDRLSGTALFVPNPPGEWSGFPVGERLAGRTGMPVIVVNDARAFALAELRLGAGRGLRDAVFAVLGTGVGGAVAMGGRVLVGPRDNLGEIGHLTVDPAGPVCCCGNRGCVETFAAAPGIVRETRRALDTAGHEGDLSDGLTPAVVADAARRGDRLAMGVLARAGQALGVGLGDAMALLGVTTAVVGGGVAGAFDLMRPFVQDELDRRRPLIGTVSVRPATLGTMAGALGAALWTREPSEAWTPGERERP